jgi:aspartyl-tRNA(Asn)/glutamyl-tRNA(Gln) amidotransferase subunit B
MKYIPVIGLEVHVELSTKSKMFCGCPADPFGKQPNTQVCPVCLGLPGALPIANKVAILDTIKMGHAFKCTIANFSKFDRKHYFYPDLPKAYQISQYDMPLCTNGLYMLNVSFPRHAGLDPVSASDIGTGQRQIADQARNDGDTQPIRIRRIHLEEDTGKLVHEKLDGKRVSLIDFNRSSVPLMEMVTEPDFHDTESISEFLREVQLVVRYLEISTADMEKGSMRLEANVSMYGEEINDENIGLSKFELPDYKVELKNINSFKFLEKAIKAELKRQEDLLEKGEKIPQETRGYDEVHDETFSQRSKEDAKDYRYFPEPDLPPMRFTDEEIESIKSELPELPSSKRERFVKEWGLSSQYIETLLSDKVRGEYFEEAVAEGLKHNVSAKTIADLIVNKSLDKDYPEPEGLVKKIVELTKRSYAEPEAVKLAVEQVVQEQTKPVTDYKNGNANVVGFLIGQVQKILKGQGEPKLIQELLLKELQK